VAWHVVSKTGQALPPPTGTEACPPTRRPRRELCSARRFEARPAPQALRLPPIGTDIGIRE